MRLKHLLLLTSAGVFGLLVHAGLSTGALAQSAPALAGQVTSAEEGPMEGVLVSARKQSSTITVTVVTDAKGGYRGRWRQGGHQARQDEEPGEPALQRRMADQRARPRQPQGQHDQLRELPHAAA